MRIRTLLLAGAVLPFAVVGPALAIDAPASTSTGLVLAQAEEPCPEGTDCPPVEPSAEPAGEEEPQAAPMTRQQRAQERARRQQERLQRRQQRQQQERPAAEEPAAEQPAAAEEPAPEPAAEEPAATPEQPAEEQAAPMTRQQRLQERARRQQERQQRRQQQQQEQGGVEQPAAEQPAEEAEAPGGPDGEASTVEQQLEAQGDPEEADRVRELRQKLRRQRREARQGDQPADEAAQGEGRVVERRGDRLIVDLGGGQIVVRRVVPDESERLLHRADDVRVENLEGGRTRTIVFRTDGSRIVTVRNRNGEIIRRVRVTPDGREIVLIDTRDRPRRPVRFLNFPPPVIGIPRDQYVVDLGRASQRDIEGALLAPPVQPLEDSYTLDEVTQNEELRAYVPRIDLDTITFEFGSAVIDETQLDSLDALGVAMEEVIAENPDEVYLIEGHTDAVGSDYDNLVLSDSRAESVAVALSQDYEIPPENLVTEGYGEQYLKVETPEPERQNRRVTVRRITPLLQAETQQ